MALPTPIVDAAEVLVEELAACIDANGLGLPANRGVVFCTPCILPGCCDLLIGVLSPPTVNRKACLGEEWDLTVWYGTCYQPCGAETPPDVWLPAQAALARRLEQVLTAMTQCRECQACDQLVRVEKFCEGGCAGWKVTYRLLQL
jgi:hypothetical protein